MIIPIKPEILDAFRPQSSPVLQQFFTDWWQEKHHDVIVSGPRNCAKTLHIWILILNLIEDFPGIQIGIARVEKTTIKATVFKTLTNKVLRYPINDPRNPFHVDGGEFRPNEIRFDNGSAILFGGMDDSAKILGADLDVFWYNEIHRELKEENYANIKGTLEGGRGGKLKVGGKYFDLFIGDCNPDNPHHWVQKRVKEGTCKYYEFTHKEHPWFYEHDASKKYSVPRSEEEYHRIRDSYTDRGRETIEGLMRAYPEGHLQDRMVWGIWAGASGLVYPEFKPDKHRKKVEWSEVQNADEWHWSVDFGGDAPMAAVLIAKRSGLPYVIFKEIYNSKCGGRPMIIEDLIRQMRDIEAKYGISQYDITKCVTDHYTENHEQLARAGYPVILGKKDIISGIQVAKQMLRNDKIILNSESLWEVDHTLGNKANSFYREILGYAYRSPEEQKGDITDEKPKKGEDHAMDWFRYWAKSEMQEPLYVLN